MDRSIDPVSLLEQPSTGDQFRYGTSPAAIYRHQFPSPPRGSTRRPAPPPPTPGGKGAQRPHRPGFRRPRVDLELPGRRRPRIVEHHAPGDQGDREAPELAHDRLDPPPRGNPDRVDLRRLDPPAPLRPRDRRAPGVANLDQRAELARRVIGRGVDRASISSQSRRVRGGSLSTRGPGSSAGCRRTPRPPG